MVPEEECVTQKANKKHQKPDRTLQCWGCCRRISSWQSGSFRPVRVTRTHPSSDRFGYIKVAELTSSSALHHSHLLMAMWASEAGDDGERERQRTDCQGDASHHPHRASGTRNICALLGAQLLVITPAQAFLVELKQKTEASFSRPEIGILIGLRRLLSRLKIQRTRTYKAAL